MTGIITFNNNPVGIATVWLYDIENSRIAQSNLGDQGEYSFKNIEPGSYSIWVSFTDFENKRDYDKIIKVIIICVVRGVKNECETDWCYS